MKDFVDKNELLDYKAAVGPPALFDLIGAHQFCVAVGQGLRTHHLLLDFGCGCLRGGKYFIPYLAAGGYTGIEPNRGLLWAGVNNVVPAVTIEEKKPRFYDWDDFVFADRLPIRYNFVLAQSILTHTGPELFAHFVNEAYSALTHDGVFLATVFVGTEMPKERRGWLGTDAIQFPTRYIYEVMKYARFKDYHIRNFNHPMGQFWITAKKE